MFQFGVRSIRLNKYFHLELSLEVKESVLSKKNKLNLMLGVRNLTVQPSCPGVMQVSCKKRLT